VKALPGTDDVGRHQYLAVHPYDDYPDAAKTTARRQIEVYPNPTVGRTTSAGLALAMIRDEPFWMSDGLKPRRYCRSIDRCRWRPRCPYAPPPQIRKCFDGWVSAVR